MREYSEAAWKIASLYSSVLASETRDLAAHIDAALKAERVRTKAFFDQIEKVAFDIPAANPHTPQIVQLCIAGRQHS